tara:strand:+ start:933 stop:1325 length:393 start_codon:yes stop_codon:yes gene_type:complete
MIAILDFGSQYTKIIARKIREAHVYCEVLSHRTSVDDLKKRNIKGLILSGGPHSVFNEDAPDCDPHIFSQKWPLLGICYGMQLIAKHLGGEVTKGKSQEYGHANLLIDDNFFYAFSFIFTHKALVNKHTS